MELTLDHLESGIIQGNRRLLAKAISLVESTLHEDFAKSQKLIERLLPRIGNAFRIGITGVPGVGKSTFIEAFGLMLLEKGKSVAVLAVDPSSERTGGSILGDKTRMMHLARSERAFIRPSPTSGALGGVARKTREAMLLCEAAGYDVILVETVGVGQSETSVASMVDFFLALMLANAGDELQGIKRGIMEMADAVVINKADGSQKESARLAQSNIRSALHYFPPKYPDWKVPTLLCSALEKTGIGEIWEVCQEFFAENRAEAIRTNRRSQSRTWMYSVIDQELHSLFYEQEEVKKFLTYYENLVENGEKSPTAGAFELLSLFQERIFRKNIEE